MSDTLIDDIWKSNEEHAKKKERDEAAYQELLQAIEKYQKRAEIIETKLEIATKHMTELEQKIDGIEDRVMEKFSANTAVVEEHLKASEEEAARIKTELDKIDEVRIKNYFQKSNSEYAIWGAMCGLVLSIVVSIVVYLTCSPKGDVNYAERIYFNQDYGWEINDDGQRTGNRSNAYIYFTDDDKIARSKIENVRRWLKDQGKER